MTTVGDIYRFLDGWAPFATQMGFDNAGLQVGSMGDAVGSALVCLDVMPQTIAQAAHAGCQLVVSHHPVLFRARKQLPAHDPAWLLARHGIAALACHTNLDIAPGGVNDVLAARLELPVVEALPCGVRLCAIAPTAAQELARRVGVSLRAHVRYCDAGKPIATVAVCGGSGWDLMEEIYGRADAYLTGDADHHNFLEAAQRGLSLLAAGHYETEIPMIPVLAQRLRAAFPEISWQEASELGGILHA
ncbi:MAG: Nif3-like dinuclear metal center hexameric protein [Oscillospiraceae bacterium]|jgi:dinuclear metal center YbgI/SA1388 family protein|nr:Nif3-like dinuclear metal center hexameric protein [Oscillospiraceae bacterium]